MHLSANLEGYPFFAKIFLRFSKLPSCRDLYEEHRACSRKSRVEINPLWYRYRAWMIQNGCTLPGKGSREGDLSMRLTYPFSLLFVLFPCFVLVTFVRCCNYFNTVCLENGHVCVFESECRCVKKWSSGRVIQSYSHNFKHIQRDRSMPEFARVKWRLTGLIIFAGIRQTLLALIGDWLNLPETPSIFLIICASIC